MKGVICYYSNTGNTKRACQYIAGRLGFPFDWVDVTKERAFDVEAYDVVGFATYTDFVGVPRLFLDFLEGLPSDVGKLAFVINTYGLMSGRTLRVLEKQVAARGFQVVAGYSLHTPENYPPMIAGGQGAADAPDEQEKAEFDDFIAGLGGILQDADAGVPIKPQRVRIGLLNSLIPVLSRTKARKDMGEKYVDAELCIECGLCVKLCPYDAIKLEPKPVFDMSKCYGCWRCYNRCPEHAIYTDKFRGGPYYPGPNEHVKETLSV